MKLGYFLSETVTNLRRNFLMTVAAISTVAISLLLLGGVQILGLVVNRMTDEWEAKVEVSVYMRDDASPNEEQAFAEFKEQYPDLWEGLPKDALPASYRVKLLDANDAVEVAARVEGAPGVDEVKFGGDVIKTLLQVNTLLRSVTFVMSVILMIAAGALIANTIRLAIYARRDEIGIMKLVGATNWFIRIPFMLEGLFAALVGAASAIGIVLGANWLLFSRIGRAIPLLDDVLRFSGGELMGVTIVLVAVGALVGLIGSGLALRRFLEV